MDAIGSFSFVRMSGHPPRATPNFALERRSGINGITIWETGAAGRPFRLQTMDFALNYAAAAALYVNYLSLLFQGPVQIVKGSLISTHWYKVLEIHPTQIEAIVRGHKPGDSTVYQGLCVCDWILVPIDPSVQPPA
jgi:hypothetical protein